MRPLGEMGDLLKGPFMIVLGVLILASVVCGCTVATMDLIAVTAQAVSVFGTDELSHYRR
jgi:hypothetical protein